ncbi:Transcriptional regulator GlxA family, contains an amidase domain and an AraC-type DNA-binding HTH domain [Modicisalibacter muralis]|uniref:Transcriptional regulator GlxA family, contains an amidase domain and an AraC-type DNA-binding HTH domain n=1 Tax=Modicisalibacter muralis TaxID=119000 RepID=A0A1G9NV53_9GAMM|nr:helix-turn-helix domain-containing protein [Halomonas muralis]SDL89865.1 Transcriptional regulator GlxA family, contains an amidase domain and an AraC-type DNA-binding HTH domain [Halomonas muralis]
MQKKPLIMLLAAPETSASVLYGLYDVLLSVGAVYLDMVAGTPGKELLDVRIVSADGRPFRCIGNIPVEPHAAIDDLVEPDAVIVCDMYTSIYDVPKGRYPREAGWLRQMHGDGALITSVCSGSLLLAEAGLLNGHEATAHWAYRDMFQRHYPEISLHSESVLCLAAEGDHIVTAGGVSAWHDLAVYLIARFCGYRHAIETAKVFLISGHSEGQSPYSVMTRPMESADGSISDCQAWIADNYATTKPVEKMVERSGLNTRTFSRRFRAATGFSPIEFVQAIRVEEAKQILETDALSIEEVGAAVGYEDPASFRRVFKRNVGQSPAAYRKKFQRISQIARPIGAQ